MKHLIGLLIILVSSSMLVKAVETLPIGEVEPCNDAYTEFLWGEPEFYTIYD